MNSCCVQGAFDPNKGYRNEATHFGQTAMLSTKALKHQSPDGLATFGCIEMKENSSL
jgi:hypothetical protein